MVLAVAVFAYAHGFYVLYRLGGGADGGYDGWIVVLTMYRAMVSDFDFSTLGEGSETQYVLGVIYLCSFTFFVSIVMLNLLIALMGDIYAGVQENVENEWLLERAKIILELEPFLSTADKASKENFPSWVHVLCAASSEEDVEADNYYLQLSRQFDKLSETVRVEVRGVELRTKTKIDERVDASEARLGESLLRLTQTVEKRLPVPE